VRTTPGPAPGAAARPTCRHPAPRRRAALRPTPPAASCLLPPPARHLTRRPALAPQALSGEGPPLDEALLKNVYSGDGAKHPYAQLLSQYLLHQERCLAVTDTDKVLLGQIRFSSVAEGGGGDDSGGGAQG
jgi:hypothetical protein